MAWNRTGDNGYTVFRNQRGTLSGQGAVGCSALETCTVLSRVRCCADDYCWNRRSIHRTHYCHHSDFTCSSNQLQSVTMSNSGLDSNSVAHCSSLLIKSQVER